MRYKFTKDQLNSIFKHAVEIREDSRRKANWAQAIVEIANVAPANVNIEYNFSTAFYSAAIQNILDAGAAAAKEAFTYIVGSRSGNRAHTVRDGRCDCQGYVNRGKCWVTDAIARSGVKVFLTGDFYIVDEKSRSHSVLRVPVQ